jgi:hypothetical protein
VEREIDRAAIYCSAPGIKYFGNWLMDDCPTYQLAVAEGEPVTATRLLSRHMPGYESLFSMQPTRVDTAFLRQAIVFDDIGQNRNKRSRFRSLGERLISNIEVKPHPGVFLLRGETGQRRILRNEKELAEQLRERRGFRVLDPSAADIPTIIAACAGARIVAGLEGSHLVHGLLFLPVGGGLFTIQPPNRFVTVLKDLTDRDHQSFGFVVGTPDGADFRADLSEIERTLDMFSEA